MKPTRALLALFAAGLIGAAGAASAIAGSAKGETGYAGGFKDSAGTLTFGVDLNDAGKPKEVNNIDPEDVPADCTVSGETIVSPTITETTNIKRHRKFKLHLADPPDFKFVFKGRLLSGHKAKGTMVYEFTETEDDECSTGEVRWKAEEVL